MYDFWFTLGAGIIDPAGLDKALQGTEFYFCQRLTLMLEESGPRLLNGPSTGELDKDTTPKVRLEISKFVHAGFDSAPPIGIYTAGRFCQLKQIPVFRESNPQSKLKDILDSCNGAYQEAIRAVGPSKLPKLPALLGLCLLDGNFVAAIIKHPSGPQPAQDQMVGIAAEFGVAPGTSDWKFVLAFVTSQQFRGATDLFMARDDKNPWAKTGGTLEQAMFWVGKTEYAIP